jgi:hypothetical protein
VSRCIGIWGEEVVPCKDFGDGGLGPVGTGSHNDGSTGSGRAPCAPESLGMPAHMLSCTLPQMPIEEGGFADEAVISSRYSRSWTGSLGSRPSGCVDPSVVRRNRTNRIRDETTCREVSWSHMQVSSQPSCPRTDSPHAAVADVIGRSIQRNSRVQSLLDENE